MRDMKDSGYLWIGNIPEDWNISKVKHIFEIGRGRVIAKTELEESGYPVYSSQTKNNGVLGYIKTYDFDRSQLTWTTDGANAGTVFLREGQHNCTNVCGTLMPKNDLNDLRYLKYALAHIAHYHKRADTNGFKIMNNEMAEIEMILPSKSEQEQIVRILDSKSEQIDTLISNQEQQIEKLKSYQQSLITEVVTKGLNPDVQIKDSGIDWMKKMPAHWNTVLLSSIVSQRKNKNTGMKESNLLSLSYGNVIRKNIKSSDGLLPENFEGYNIIESGDIVLRLTDLQNDHTSLRTGLCTEKGIITSAYVTLNNWTDLMLSEYLHYYLHSFDIYKGFYGMGSGVRQGLTFDGIKKLVLMLPPLEEQQEIVEYLDSKCSQIDRLIEIKQSKIEKLGQYKKSLIYEYVTGKKEA